MADSRELQTAGMPRVISFDVWHDKVLRKFSNEGRRRRFAQNYALLNSLGADHATPPPEEGYGRLIKQTVGRSIVDIWEMEKQQAWHGPNPPPRHFEVGMTRELLDQGCEPIVVTDDIYKKVFAGEINLADPPSE